MEWIEREMLSLYLSSKKKGLGKALLNALPQVGAWLYVN